MSTIWLVSQYSTTPKTGGYLRHHYLARELAKLGHDVYLIAGRMHHMITDPALAATAPVQERLHGYTMVRVDTVKYPQAHHRKRALGWIQFAWKIAGLQRKGLPSPDAVLYSSPNLFSFLGAEWAARRAGATLTFEVRDVWPLSLMLIGGFRPGHPVMRLLQKVEDRAYRVSHQVVSNLPNVDEHMVSRGMDKKKFHWIPNGVDLADTELQQPLSDSVRHQLPLDKFIVGYVGTIGEANNLDVLLIAAEQLQDQPGIAFVLVGEGKKKQELKQRAAAMRNVTMLDSIPKTQVQSMLSHFDACYIGLPPKPLFRFGVSPNKLFDYFAAAKPVIYAIDSGRYNPVIAHDAGVSIPPGDPAAIVHAVTKLANMSKSARVEMGQRGLKCVKEEYDFKTLGRKLESVLAKGKMN